MNKKIFIIIFVILIPSIIAAIWFVSNPGDKLTVSNVESIKLITPEQKVWQYTKDEEKEEFISLINNLTPQEKQEFSDEWSVYTLEFNKTYETVKYYLCLSQNVKSCVAYDDNDNWYRINFEDARNFLVREELSTVYTNSTCPEVCVIVQGVPYVIPAKEYEWNYLLADGSYATDIKENIDLPEVAVTVSDSGYSIDYSVEADWYEVKLYNGEDQLFSDDLSDFTQDAVLRAVVESKWYEDDSKLYHGRCVNEFIINYDVKAKASLDKQQYYAGEVVYILIENAQMDDFSINTDLNTSQNPVIRQIDDKKYLVLPVSSDNASGSYTVTLTSQYTTISLGFEVIGKENSDKAKFELSSHTADEYENALTSFANETYMALHVSESGDIAWYDGFTSPLVKMVDDKESYWVSSPRYGEIQVVNGEELPVRNFGSHYIRSVDFEELTLYAVSDGKVVFAGNTTAFGNTVILDHGFGLMSVYGHLKELEVEVGKEMKKGDVIAVSGNTGILIKDGDIFFGMLQDGVFVNPGNFIDNTKLPLVSR